MLAIQLIGLPIHTPWLDAWCLMPPCLYIYIKVGSNFTPRRSNATDVLTAELNISRFELKRCAMRFAVQLQPALVAEANHLLDLARGGAPSVAVVLIGIHIRAARFYKGLHPEWHTEWQQEARSGDDTAFAKNEALPADVSTFFFLFPFFPRPPLFFSSFLFLLILTVALVSRFGRLLATHALCPHALVPVATAPRLLVV